MSVSLTLFILALAPQASEPAAVEAGSVGAFRAGMAIRGITISTHGSGRDWGHDNIVPTMTAIRGVGSGWVATHPYARIHADGAVTFRDFEADRPPAYLVRPIAEAHALGLKIMIKPHLAYWGSPFKWRGEISFDEPAKWERFWGGYSRWILRVARACRHADAFAVGTELDRTLHDEERWREVVRGVRAETGAALTYAANWTDYTRVGFWDALDAVGIQAYFPLTEQRDPDEAALRLAWQQQMRHLSRYAVKVGRPVVFTELGYNCSHLAPIRPWESRTDGADAEPVQLRCMRSALEAIEGEPTVLGAFLWKWFPIPNRGRGNFLVDTPRMKELLREVWGE